MRRLQRRFEEQAKSRRRGDVEATPRYRLEAVHCEGATLLPNRAALIQRLPSQAIVAELGSDEGDFSAEILETCRPKKLHLVDAWRTARYGEDKAQAVATRFQAEINEGQLQITRKLSVEAAADFNDGYFDWIYIDTDHSYKTTIKELYSYAPKVKDGGFIAGHDYVMGNWVTSYKYGVIEAVAEFCVKEAWKVTFLTADVFESRSFALTRI